MLLLSACIILITTVTTLWSKFPKCMKQHSICFMSLEMFSMMFDGNKKKKKTWSFPFPPSLGGCCKDDIVRLNLIYRLNLQKIIQKGTEGHMYLNSFCSICSVYSLFRDVYLTAFKNPDFSMFMFCISFHLFSCSFIFSFSTFFPDTLWLIVFKHLNLSFPNHRNKLTLYKPPIPLSLWLYFLTQPPLCLIFCSTRKN